jgi:thiol:disulfide interchange protein DsbD
VISILAAIVAFQGPACKLSVLPVLEEARGGKPIEVALTFDLEPGWHIYWKNPGDSGEATRVDWKLPQGWSLVGIRFPTPHAIDMAGITNYGYENRVTLAAQLLPPPSYVGEPVKFSGMASYLICKEACVPGSRTFEFSLPGPALDPSEWREASVLFPREYKRDAHAKYDNKFLVLQLPEKRIIKAYFFAENDKLVSHSDAQTLRKAESGYELLVPLSEYQAAKPSKIGGVLVLTDQDAMVRSYNIEFSASKNTNRSTP